jgi:hypothetical protein
LEGRNGELGVFNVLAGFHLIINHHVTDGVGIENLLLKLGKNGAILKGGEFIHVIAVEREEKGMRIIGDIDPFSDAEIVDFRDFKEADTGFHHQVFEFFPSHVRFGFQKANMMNHRVKILVADAEDASFKSQL